MKTQRKKLSHTQKGAGIDSPAAGQQQVIAINRGLFVVRYARAEDELRPPKIMVSQDVASSSDIEFCLHPDHTEAVLSQPDSCLVVRATAPATLAVKVFPAEPNGSAAATVRIEPLSQGLTEARLRQTAAPGLEDLSTFKILAHVSRVGDVVAAGNEWIAGPAAPSRIEGISIDWPGKPADLDIQYAIRTPKSPNNAPQKTTLGKFAGTRGKALPVVGLMLEMSGPAASRFQISAETIFLGSPATRISGKRIVVSGPTGREPLVGLKLTLVKIETTVQKSSIPLTDDRERSSGRVRVFRSKALTDRRSAESAPA